VPAFSSLMHLGSNEFYGDDQGVNYAESRYLLYYLQQTGKLRGFYKAFRAAHDKDPSGFTTLTKTVGDLAKLQPAWESWVAKLKFQ
jgi:hypothetical protein